MYLSNLSASQVWASSSRSLTNFGASAFTFGSDVLTNIAANTAVTITPSAGVGQMITVAAQTGAAATASVRIQLQNGANSILLAQSAAAATSPTGFTLFANNTCFTRLFNADAAVVATYLDAQLLWTQ